MRRLLLVLTTLLLCACSRGPQLDNLHADLQARLQQVFGTQLLQLTELQRRGSGKDTQAPAGSEQRVVYFDAKLQLQQDHDFSAWDSPGVASLLSSLGAGPRGISGILSGGNHAGDVLRVHGSLIYQRQGDTWQALVAQGFSQPQQASSAQVDSSQLVAAISTALHLAPGGTSVRARAIIQDELARALAIIQGRISRQEQGYALAAGPDYGQYSRFASALSSLLQAKGIKLAPLLTQGSQDNLRMLRQGDAQLALAQSDTAYLAAHGRGPFANDGANPQLRALATLYPEPLHVLVRADGPQQISELRGKRLNLGPLDSASRDTALAVLAAHGLSPADLASSDTRDLPEALAALRDGQLDAVLQIIGAPASTIGAASEALDLRLLPLDPVAVAQVQQQRPGTFAYRLAAGSYPGQTQAVDGIAVSSLLLSQQELSEGETSKLLQLLFDTGEQWLALGSVQATQLTPPVALTDIGIPWHAGALQDLKQRQDAARSSN